MKKILSASALFLIMMSCGNSGNNVPGTTDTGESANPSAIDTTQHPNGMTSGSVISTDTASMNVENVGNPHGGDSSNPK
jgi:hypothetical protein